MTRRRPYSKPALADLDPAGVPWWALHAYGNERSIEAALEKIQDLAVWYRSVVVPRLLGQMMREVAKVLEGDKHRPRPGETVH